MTTTPTTSLVLGPSATRPRTDRVLVRLAIATATGFVVLSVVAGLLDPGYDVRSEAISALSSTESASAPAMIAGFGLLGLSMLLTGMGLLRRLRGKAAVASGVLVLLSGVLTFGEGYFRQSCSTLQQTCLARESAGQVAASHVLHNLIALPLFTSLVVVGFLLTPALRRHGAPRSTRLWVLVGAVTSTSFLVWFGSGAYGPWGGLVERVLVLLAFGVPLAVLAGSPRAGGHSAVLATSNSNGEL